ncbi:MAG TPA: exodeoxyribonuclease III [Candidatus Nanopelagicales bacterium]
MRIVTWNVNSLAARLPRLLGWLEAAQPDVVVLQETKLAQEGFPTEQLAAAGYASAHRGQGRWNGVAVLSRVGIEAVETDLPGCPGFPGAGDPAEARYLAATCGGVRVAGVYVPNGRTVDDPHYEYKLAWLAALAEHLGPVAAAPTPFAVMGDFNIAPNDDDVWDIAAFAGSTHVTAQERAALADLRAQGLADVVPTISKGPHPYTYWDYRGGAFHKAMGMRIDLVYGNAPFVARVRGAWVDREARKPGVKGTPPPSDHAPVVVDLV